MFNTHGDMQSTTNLKIMYQFDEGAGGAGATVDNKGSEGSSSDGVLSPSGYAPNWLSAGTWQCETGNTFTMKTTGKSMILKGDTEFYNLSVAQSGETTNLYNPLNVTSALYINSGGTLTHGGGTFQVSGGSSGYYPNVVCKGTYSANADFEDLYTFYWVGNSVSHVQPAGTFNYLLYDNAYNGGSNYNVTLGGNITGGNYVSINDGCGLNTRSSGVDYNIDTARLIMRSTANLTLNSSTLKFTNTTGLDISYTGNTLSAGPGCVISGTSANTTFKSQQNWQVVGNCVNLNVTNEELSVTGQVINCTGDIIQQHPSQDANQQLDYDTADDRDVMLGRDLDKNTELVG